MKLLAKTSIALGLLLIILSTGSLVTGCATRAQVVRTDPGTGLSHTNTEYILPSWASNAPLVMQQVGGALPFPYGEAVGLGGLGLSAVLAFYLRLKNQSLKSANGALGAISEAALQSHIGEDLKRALVETASAASVMNHATVQTIVSKPKPEELNSVAPRPPTPAPPSV